MIKVIVILFSLILGGSCLALEKVPVEEKVSAETLKGLFVSAAKRYIKENSNKNEDLWQKKLLDKIKQKIEDNAVLNENTALNSIILEWASSKVGQEITVEFKLEIARFIVFYNEFSFELPERFKEHLTLENYNKWVMSE